MYVVFVVVSNSTSGNETKPNPIMSSSPCYLKAKESSTQIPNLYEERLCVI